MITTSILAAAIMSTWQPVTISYYDSGYKTADGTRFHNSGKWAATYLAPLGAKIEVKYGNVTQILTVRDRTAKRFGHRLDLPRRTWERFGASTSRGLLRGSWRRVK